MEEVENKEEKLEEDTPAVRKRSHVVKAPVFFVVEDGKCDAPASSAASQWLRGEGEVVQSETSSKLTSTTVSKSSATSSSWSK